MARFRLFKVLKNFKFLSFLKHSRFRMSVTSWKAYNSIFRLTKSNQICWVWRVFRASLENDPTLQPLHQLINEKRESMGEPTWGNWEEKGKREKAFRGHQEEGNLTQIIRIHTHPPTIKKRIGWSRIRKDKGREMGGNLVFNPGNRRIARNRLYWLLNLYHL